MDIQETIRKTKKILLDLHHEAHAGHIGGNFSCIDSLVVLFHRVLRKEDCFLLSKGHSAGALYAVLNSTGAIPDEELKTFTKDGTRLGVHPPVNCFREIPFGTGSLGHGLSLCAGMALGRKLSGKPGTVYCLVSDGELEEGSCREAVQFIRHHGLDNLKILADVNGWQGFGSTEETAGWNLDGIRRFFESAGLTTETVDGHDPEAIEKALRRGRCVILLKTVKGHGIPCFENTLRSHYLPLSEEEYAEASARIDIDPEGDSPCGRH